MVQVEKLSFHQIKNLVLAAITVVALGTAVWSLYGFRYVMFNDGEILPDGTMMVCQYEIVRHPDPLKLGDLDCIFFIDGDGNIVREISKSSVPMDQPHSATMLPGGSILVANCRNDTIMEIDPENKVSWTYDLRLLNWTVYDPLLFGPACIVNNPSGNDWSHVNDVDVVERDGSMYMLVSARNFDMIFEVNYSSARLKDTPDPADITWHFGYPGNHELLNRQHNPDYMGNGHVLVADSENNRVIEIDPANGTIAWVSPASLMLNWPRDVDLKPGTNDTLLITDSLNHRVIEFDRESNQITWFYTGDLIQPYQSDYLDGEPGKVLISDGVGGCVMVVDMETKAITRAWFAYPGSFEFGFLVFMLVFIVSSISLGFHFVERFVVKESKMSFRKFIAVGAFTATLQFFFLFSMFQPQWFLKLVVHVINILVR